MQLHRPISVALLERAWVNPEIPYPPPNSPPISGLPVYRGYGCPHCDCTYFDMKGDAEASVQNPSRPR
ncbi:uncharacterized protein BO80DRAFT_429283 [Aspergillus ibericus CBS 121593]|uniref:Uncharacterized protein n=1 Tax=Aspergillus ibericus CBS 121593 TaxID=1448316 RepID=A0A395GLD2_9EURO|nr:hypothetical protein BO80DRAFT_429283 [Aspergillus ibericus CBS 121593]RAK96162.1 hypothetical protein BO80DRAFT_429283 [Aspergillus ibericus CBS 121593]